MGFWEGFGQVFEMSLYTIFIVSDIWKKKPTNAYTFIITPQYLKRVKVEK